MRLAALVCVLAGAGYWAGSSYFSLYETCLREPPYERWKILTAKQRCAHLLPAPAIEAD